MRALLLLVVAAVPPAYCNAPQITLRNTFSLPATAVDQFGEPFTVTGLSGLTWRQGGEFIAVMDNSNHLLTLDVALAGNGAITGATISAGFSLSESRDFEGIALAASDSNVIYLAEEDTPAVRQYARTDGAAAGELPLPPVYANRRPNFGLESLARSRGGGALWTANEEALSVDGPLSSPANGTVVRLQKFSGPPYSPAGQFAYQVERMHGGNISNGRSGLSELVALPGGRLLALERSFAFNLSGLFRTRIFLVHVDGATDISALPGLAGAAYTPVTKQLLFSENLNNLEGLALGPRLGPGRYALLGIVDDGDPLSTNQLVAFELAGVFIPADLDCDGAVGNFDIDPFVLALSDAAAYHALYPDCAMKSADVNGDGMVNNFDIDAFVACLVGGCD